MKKILFALLVSGILTSLLVFPAAAYTISPKILAGQNTFVGVVKITGNADGTMTLNFMLQGGLGYCMTEWAAHAGATLDDFPTNDGGAIPGQFDYKSTFSGCVTRDSLIIDPPGGFGDDVYLAIHVVVNGPDMVGETGWVVRCGDLEGAQFPGNNWSAWILYPAKAWLDSW